MHFEAALAILSHSMLARRASFLAGALAIFVVNATASQVLIPSFPEGCPYIDTSCTRVELLPIKRNDTCHQNIAAGFAQDVAAADAQQGVEVVFYGDSLTKQWRSVQPQVNGTPEVFTTYFGNYSAAVLGVGEDQASNLLWRLQNGEVLVKHPPKVAIVLIGTNDLGAGGSCNVGEPGVTAVANGTALRIQAVVTYLQQMNLDTHIVLMGLLPWGLVNQAGVYEWPNLYTKGIAIVNSLIEASAAEQSNVHYVDCGQTLYPMGQILESVSPDGLHPNAMGMGRLAECITPLVYQFANLPTTSTLLTAGRH